MDEIVRVRTGLIANESKGFYDFKSQMENEQSTPEEIYNSIQIFANKKLALCYWGNQKSRQMKISDINSPENILHYIEGCVNDFEGGISTKDETVVCLAEMVLALVGATDQKITIQQYCKENQIDK